MKLTRFLSLIFILVSFAGCVLFHEDKAQKTDIDTSELGDLSGGSKISFVSIKEKLFAPRCISCHGNSGGVNLETYASVKENISRIARSALVEKSMPKNSLLSKEERKLLASWIKAGAPQFGSDPDPVEEPLKASYKSIVKKIFEIRCLSCHTDGQSGHRVPLVPYNEIMDSSLQIVIPKNPEDSELMIAITREDSDSKRMPPPDKASRLSDEEIQTIRRWIENGALNEEN